MGTYFDKFPQVKYSLADDGSNPQTVTDVTFPVRLLQKYASDTQFFYKQIIKDGLKPEDVAFIVYGDVQLHWLVLQFNKVIDPRFEWALASKDLEIHIADKYGSIGNAGSTIHTYYKTIKRVSSKATKPSIEDRFEINQAEYANTTIDLGGASLLLGNGEIVTTYTNRDTLSAYDFEVQQNDARREIFLVQKPYVDQIRASFDTLTKNR